MKWDSQNGLRVLERGKDLYLQLGSYAAAARTLNNEFKINIDGDALRKAIKYHDGKHPKPKGEVVRTNMTITLPIDRQEPDPAVLEAMMEQSPLTYEELATEEEMIRQAREKARDDRDKKLLQKLLKERGKTELLIETLRECVQAFPAPKAPVRKPAEARFDDEEALLLFSDAQIGEEIKPEETNGFGHYNLEIFKKRMQFLTDEVERIGLVQGALKPIRTLNIFMLGDNVDGIGIYRGQEHHLDALVVDQWLVGTHEIAKSLIQLLDTYEKINITGIVGNHGRMGRKGENPITVNWDYVLYKTLEMLLVNYGDRIEWNIPKSNWTLSEVNGQSFLLLHGDTIKGWNGLPYYGIDRADSKLTNMLASKGKYFRYLCLGHHHNPADIDSPGGEKILNGTMVGGSDFSINQLHTSSRPSQWFFGVDRKRGITWRHKILLDETE